MSTTVNASYTKGEVLDIDNTFHFENFLNGLTKKTPKQPPTPQPINPPNRPKTLVPENPFIFHLKLAGKKYCHWLKRCIPSGMCPENKTNALILYAEIIIQNSNEKCLVPILQNVFWIILTS